MDTSVDRIRQLLRAERISLLVGLATMVVAVGFGILAGAPMLLGLVGVVVVAVAVSSTAWRNRRRQVAGSSVGGVLAHFAAAGVATLLLAQLVPYGRSHSNPATTGEPAWSSPQTRELMVNACFGCHSNEVEWPWYSSVAPVSWVVTAHVDEGRDEVNYSEFATDPGEAEETVEVILEGSMPPSYYTAFGLHPEAKLTDSEIAELVAGLRLTPGMTEDD